MILGILGKKVGMTQTFAPEGRIVGLSAIEAGPCTVTQVKSADKDGYEAVQIGFVEAKKVNSPEAGHLGKAGKMRYLREVSADSVSGIEVGQKVDVAIFEKGEKVDVTAISKGKGFAGGVKRYHFRGGPKTHGQSDRHRAPGAVGATTSPGRVLRGVRMAGHMGAAQVTVQRLEVLEADPARNLLLLKGGVPGPKGGLVIIQKAGKRK